MTKTIRTSVSTLKLINRYYKITNFYSFLKGTAIKAGIVIVAFVSIFLALEYFFFDFNSILDRFVATYSSISILSFFLLSETILGLIPPEIFIAWASKTTSPWFFLFTIATMSYLGGVIAYFVGNRLFLIPAVKNHIENKIYIKMHKYIIFLNTFVL